MSVFLINRFLSSYYSKCTRMGAEFPGARNRIVRGGVKPPQPLSPGQALPANRESRWGQRTPMPPRFSAPEHPAA
jgi:hypothetical protein